MSKSVMPKAVCVYNKAENTACKGKWSLSDTIAEGGMIIRLAEKVRMSILMQRADRLGEFGSAGMYVQR